MKELINQLTNDLLVVVHGLNKFGYAWTSNETIANMYLANANEYHEYSVKKEADAWLIEVVKKQTYKEYIEDLKTEWINKVVKYDGSMYKVVDVDYNGMLLINKKSQFTETTAISKLDIE